MHLFLFQLHEEKIAAIQEKLELSDQKLAQFSKLPEMEEELKARMEALTQVGAQVGRVIKMFNTSNFITKFLYKIKILKLCNIVFDVNFYFFWFIFFGTKHKLVT